MTIMQSLVPWACKQGSKSEAGAIKTCKEIKITAPPNAWHNIQFSVVNKICWLKQISLNQFKLKFDPILTSTLIANCRYQWRPKALLSKVNYSL